MTRYLPDHNEAPAPWVTRFAPSPTGYLHLGHLVNAIYVWGLARALDGRVILRLEDHDRGRCRPAYEAAIHDDLAWLGLTPDGDSLDSLQRRPSSYRQSDNVARYQTALESLAARGLVYTCTCSRAAILARTGPQGAELCYDGHCRDAGYRPDVEGGTRLRLDDETVVVEDVRMGALRQTPSRQCGDLLLKDRHGCWTYHFAVVVDDLEHGVNLVIRGEDLLDSTGRQVLLGGLLGREAPPAFLHHPLITAPDGAKLSKRDFAKGLRDYRAEGRSAASVLGEAAWRVGLLPEGETLSADRIPALFEDDRMVQTLLKRERS
ncbi:MAG: tRNA glutamyl-Q(34) synthetase GluQRS [Candidatus Hydrogenedentes bacterium]|nr:tRNA glutamyl-Q(34) synthetase GluQRS [Candidatus Hydrogenedentota bacterium]